MDRSDSRIYRGLAMPKQVLVDKLVNYHGYSVIKAKEVVNTIVEIMKQTLCAGKVLELPGLGALSVVQRPQRRRVERNLRNVGPTIITVNRQSKTVKLKSRRDMTYGEGGKL